VLAVSASLFKCADRTFAASRQYTKDKRYTEGIQGSVALRSYVHEAPPQLRLHIDDGRVSLTFHQMGSCQVAQYRTPVSMLIASGAAHVSKVSRMTELTNGILLRPAKIRLSL
jgi:hypothetical protein